jgi:hypothetical protein
MDGSVGTLDRFTQCTSAFRNGCGCGLWVCNPLFRRRKPAKVLEKSVYCNLTGYFPCSVERNERLRELCCELNNLRLNRGTQPDLCLLGMLFALHLTPKRMKLVRGPRGNDSGHQTGDGSPCELRNTRISVYTKLWRLQEK